MCAQPDCTCASRLVYFAWSRLRCRGAALARVVAAERCPVAERCCPSLQGGGAAGVMSVATAGAAAAPSPAPCCCDAGVDGTGPFVVPADVLRRRGGASAGLKVHSCETARGTRSEQAAGEPPA